MVYDPALTRVKQSEPRLERLRHELQSCEAGRQLLGEAADLGIRVEEQGAGRPVILSVEDRGRYFDIEAFAWQVERQRTPPNYLSRNYLNHFSSLMSRAAERAAEIALEIESRQLARQRHSENNRN